MKKIIIAMAAIAAAFTMASCNKEQPVSPNENPTVGKSVITASIENGLTKATLDENGNDTDGYKVFWSEGDKLFVFGIDESWCAEYTLDKSSAGSSMGTFIWQEGDYFITEDDYDEPSFEADKIYSAVYPYDLFYEHSYYIWKTEQTYTDMYIPMYGEAECTEDGKAEFTFTNLGGLLRLTVKGTATIKSITVQANEPMSGDIMDIYCEDNEGHKVAFMSDWALLFTPDTKNYINLDCGKNGVKLSPEGTDFYISMPCRYNAKGEEMADFDGYTDVTITLTDTKERTCVKKLNNKKLFIERSKITTATFTASEWILPGKFSVAEGKQVQFSSGNLTATVDATGAPTAWKFAANQYDYLGEGGANMTIGTAAGDVDLFGWSTAATTYGISASTNVEDYSGAFVDWGKAIGDGNTWRTLTTEEWNYLFKIRTVNGDTDKSYSINITYGGKTGLVLYPDNYDKEPISGTVTELPEGVVFLPATGFRFGSDVESSGKLGSYWSSSTDDEGNALFVSFDDISVYPDFSIEPNYGFSVRLVTDCE